MYHRSIACYIAILISLSQFASGTPDCYNATAGISKKWNGYKDILPPELNGMRADWLTISPGVNCGFYTFGNLFFNSFNATV